ncbi:MAG: toxic anion resistance protein [Culicoidibacterales bacterium]
MSNYQELAVIEEFARQAMQQIMIVTDQLLTQLRQSLTESFDQLFTKLTRELTGFEAEVASQVKNRRVTHLFFYRKNAQQAVIKKYQHMIQELDYVYLELVSYQQTLKPSLWQLEHLYDMSKQSLKQLRQFEAQSQYLQNQWQKQFVQQSESFENQALAYALDQLSQQRLAWSCHQAIAEQQLNHIRSIQQMNNQLIQQIQALINTLIPSVQSAMKRAVQGMQAQLEAQGLKALNQRLKSEYERYQMNHKGKNFVQDCEQLSKPTMAQQLVDSWQLIRLGMQQVQVSYQQRRQTYETSEKQLQQLNEMKQVKSNA